MFSYNPLFWLQTGRRVAVDGLRYWVIALLAIPLALFVGYQAIAGVGGALGYLVIAGCVAYPAALLIRYAADQGADRDTLSRSQLFVALSAVGAGALWAWLEQSFDIPLPAGNLHPLALAVVFVAAAYPIAFLTISWRQRATAITAVDGGLALISLLAGGWLIMQTGRYAEWISGIDEFTRTDQLVALAYLLLTLELLRRCVGAGLSLVLYALLVYLFFGHLLSGTFSHRQFELVEVAEEMIISLNGGLFGVPLQVAAGYAFLFILFGKFLEASGGGQFFFDLAAGVAGRRQGGVAKVAVVASGLFGTLSGSPAADVMTTGSVTIPMMKRLGYGGRFAAAVEAVASTGGSLLPPVMGAVVFLMVEFSAIPYAEIAFSAITVGLLYYFSVYLQVHWRSRKLGLTGMEEAAIPGIRQALLSGWHHLLPLGLLVILLISGFSPAVVAAGALLLLLSSSCLGRAPITPSTITRVCVEACGAMAPLVAAVTAAGLVIGCLNITGLAGKLATLIFAITGGSLLGSLLVAMVITLILGMGMPVVAAYALVATLIAPVLLELGLPALSAHLFLVYFSVLSAITPPVAIACFVASSIADENPMAVAWQALHLALVAFVIPYLFIYQPELLLQGQPAAIMVALVSTAIGIWVLSIALEGHGRRPLSNPQRLLLVMAGIALCAPFLWLSLAGIIGWIGFQLRQRIQPDHPPP
ncbi:MAG: TRAP transporter fused permease subunit [Gammaproteobacteria bacterium]